MENDSYINSYSLVALLKQLAEQFTDAVIR